MTTRIDESIESTDAAVQLRARLELARAQEETLARYRAAAWNKDPGNNGPGHVLLTAQGYHHAYTAWNDARNKVCALEKQLATLQANP